MMTRSSPSGRGFVLVLTLVILALAATILAASARYSLSLAADANARKDALQRKWIERSCQRTLLTNAETLLLYAEEKQKQPVAHVMISLAFRDHHVTAVIFDEQCKVNVNSLDEHHGVDRTRQLLLELQAASQGESLTQAMPLALSPIDIARSTEAKLDDKVFGFVTPRRNSDAYALPESSDLPRYGSYAQIFADTAGSSLLSIDDAAQRVIGPATLITCFGDGRLNLQRVSAEVLRIGCKDALAPSEADALIQLRNENPNLGPNRAMTLVDRDNANASRVVNLLTSQSNCHSLWLRIDDGRRSWWMFSVREATESGDETGKVQTFRW